MVAAFQIPLFPFGGINYQDGEPLEVAFCKALRVDPLGTVVFM